MMLFILILMLVAATNYQNSMAFLLTFILASLGFNVIIQTYRNLTGINIRTRGVDAIFAGQYLDIPIIVSSTEDKHHFSVGFGNLVEVQQVLDIPAGGSREAMIRVLPEDRGWFHPGRLYTATSYPMGLLRVWSWFQFKQQYLVYPTPVDPGTIIQNAAGKIDNEQGEMGIGNEDFAGIRSYRAGDPKRKIHWRAYAREQGLHTMEFVEPEGKSSILDYDSFAGIESELRLSWLCFLVLQAESSGERYGLKLPGTLIEPDHGNKHRLQCLKTLALFGMADVAGTEGEQ